MNQLNKDLRTPIQDRDHVRMILYMLMRREHFDEQSRIHMDFKMAIAYVTEGLKP